MVSPHQQPMLLFTNSDLTDSFTCCFCKEFPPSPILQCQNGHIICTACRQQLASCPVCQKQLADSRNLAMEQAARILLFPCRYASSGCTAILPLIKKIKHEEACKHRPCVCPYPGARCKWEGTFQEVMPHLEEQHTIMPILQGEYGTFIATKIDSRDQNEWGIILSCFSQNFLVALVNRQKSQGHMDYFGMVLIIGSPEEAQGFTYRMELADGQNELFWTAEPISIHEGAQAAMENKKCFTFSDEHLPAVDNYIFVTVNIYRLSHNSSDHKS